MVTHQFIKSRDNILFIFNTCIYFCFYYQKIVIGQAYLIYLHYKFTTLDYFPLIALSVGIFFISLLSVELTFSTQYFTNKFHDFLYKAKPSLSSCFISMQYLKVFR